MVYFISIILVILCFFFYRSKILYYSLLGYMWLLFAGSYGHADYFVQKQAYINAPYKFMNNEDPLWFIIRKIFSQMGIEYTLFLAVTSFLALIVITKVIFDYTKNTGFVLALYFLTPFILDIVQYNNFLGMVIVLFSTRYIIKGNLNIFKFLLCMSLAIGICSYTVVYLIFIIIPYWSIKKIVVCSLIGGSIIVVVPNMIFSIASKFVSLDKIEIYFAQKQKQSTFLILSLFIISSMAIIEYTYFRILKLSPQRQALNEAHFSALSVGDLIAKINILMCVVIPIQSYSLEAARMYRNVFVLNYIMVSLIQIKKDFCLKSLIVKISIVSVSFLYSFLYIYIWNKESVFVPIFENNQIVNFWFR